MTELREVPVAAQVVGVGSHSVPMKARVFEVYEEARHTVVVPDSYFGEDPDDDVERATQFFLETGPDRFPVEVAERDVYEVEPVDVCGECSSCGRRVGGGAPHEGDCALMTGEVGGGVRALEVRSDFSLEWVLCVEGRVAGPFPSGRSGFGIAEAVAVLGAFGQAVDVRSVAADESVRRLTEGSRAVYVNPGDALGAVAERRFERLWKRARGGGVR